MPFILIPRRLRTYSTAEDRNYEHQRKERKVAFTVYSSPDPRTMPRANLPLLLAYLLVLSTLAVGHTLPSLPPAFSPSLFPQRRADPESQSCGFDGDSNTYGLGIRLGLYLQWLSTALCSLLKSSSEEESKNMKGVNLCFQASVFGGLLYVTFTDGRTLGSGQLYAAEVWIMLCLCTGGFAGSLTDYTNPKYLAHNICKHVLDIAWTSYGIWFFFTGMDQMAHPPCSRYAFFYTKVDMYHWFRVLSKIGIISFLLTPIYFLAIQFAILSGNGAEELQEEIEDDIADFKTAIGLLVPLFSLVSVIISTELTIRWNHIHSVDSMGETGQLIPLIVACLTFVRLVYKLCVDYLNNSSPAREVDPNKDQ
ncbi:hypothetical protein FRC00_012642 [Tulasnella sp. 408]|nr:hypothetical protein FRC00_012642 [Tulasnella sp. 408]